MCPTAVGVLRCVFGTRGGKSNHRTGSSCGSWSDTNSSDPGPDPEESHATTDRSCREAAGFASLFMTRWHHCCYPLWAPRTHRFLLAPSLTLQLQARDEYNTWQATPMMDYGSNTRTIHHYNDLPSLSYRKVFAITLHICPHTYPMSSSRLSLHL